jgi:hypothetical protein
LFRGNTPEYTEESQNRSHLERVTAFQGLSCMERLLSLPNAAQNKTSFAGGI